MGTFMENINPFISVIIPVYNVEKYLKRCLDSILNQSFHNIEVICIDDGSTDASLSILLEYAAKDARIHVIEQSNKGVSSARNAGLDTAKGIWISFVDSDDEIHPSMYETLANHAGDEDALYFSAEEFITDGTIDGSHLPVHSGYFDAPFSGVRTVNDNEVFRFSKVIWDKLFLREKIENMHLRFPEGVYFEDNAFIINFFSLHRKVRFIQKKLYRYFRRSNSITGIANAHKANMAFDYIRILDNIYFFWKKWNILPEKQPLFEQFCIFFFRSAINICQAWELPGIVYALALSMHRWELEPKNKVLRDIKNGILSIRTGLFPRKDITMLKTLRGLKKIFYIGNFRDRRILCLFSIKIASWKRTKRI